VILVVITIHSYNGRVVDSMMIMLYAVEPIRKPGVSFHLFTWACSELRS